jgi:hypothetical protein
MIRKLIGALVLVEVARLSARAVYAAGMSAGVFANNATTVRDFLADLADPTPTAALFGTGEDKDEAAVTA